MPRVCASAIFLPRRALNVRGLHIHLETVDIEPTGCMVEQTWLDSTNRRLEFMAANAPSTRRTSSAGKWISDRQLINYLPLPQIFRIENGTSSTHCCSDD
jgi:hypothetical protein